MQHLVLYELTNDGVVLISLFTMSYSLSMIPSYFALLDRINTLYAFCNYLIPPTPDIGDYVRVFDD